MIDQSHINETQFRVGVISLLNVYFWMTRGVECDDFRLYSAQLPKCPPAIYVSAHKIVWPRISFYRALAEIGFQDEPIQCCNPPSSILAQF